MNTSDKTPSQEPGPVRKPVSAQHMASGANTGTSASTGKSASTGLSLDSNEDRELEVLLADALDAGPIPHSLLRRIDDIVEEEWGVSPRLSDKPGARLRRGLSRGAAFLMGLPVAAAIVVAVVVFFVLESSSPVYAWSSMVDALTQAGFVKAESNGVVRWMCLSEQLVGEDRAESSFLIDGSKNIVLRRDRNESQIERQQLSGSGLSRDNLMLAFLAYQTDQQLSDVLSEPIQIVGEHSDKIEIGKQERISLTVDVKVGEHQSTVLFLIDPATGLPISSEETGSESGAGESRKTAWTFSKETASARVAAVFPKDLPVIDASVVAALDTTGNTKRANSAESVAQAVTSQNSGSGSEPKETSSGADGQNPGIASVTTIGHSTMTGAASQWKPVVVHPGMSVNPVGDLDTMLERLWQEHGVQPVNPATEEELLRRVYVDLAGRTPSVPEVRDYLRDTSPRKYELIVEKLLNSPDHSSHLAARFRSFLIPEGIDLANFGGIEAFEKWLAERFESGEPYDETVRSLLLAEGRLVQSGPLLFYSATKLEPDQLAGRTARVFLGMRLECAQCHDHPFEPWTQQDFWGFAAFFARISRPKGKLENVSTVMQVRDVNRGEVSMPESKDSVAPKFLNSTTDVTTNDAVARRKQLTDWLTGSENPYFARATVNRVWSMLFGKGIVEPVDDFGVGSPPLSPELIDLLAGQLIQSKFELRSLFRTIALSKAYRLSSGAEDVNEERQKWFAQMNVKMLTAEQVYDCITVATMPGTSATENVEGGLVARFGNSSREQFLRDFRTPSGRSTEYQGGIPQALTLMNGGLVDSATGLQSSGLLKSIEAPFFNTEQRLEILYFATLARPPKPAEQQMLDEYITDGLSGPELREALSDVLWALLNSAEFSMNH